MNTGPVSENDDPKILKLIAPRGLEPDTPTVLKAIFKCHALQKTLVRMTLISVPLDDEVMKSLEKCIRTCPVRYLNLEATSFTKPMKEKLISLFSKHNTLEMIRGFDISENGLIKRRLQDNKIFNQLEDMLSCPEGRLNSEVENLISKITSKSTNTLGRIKKFREQWDSVSEEVLGSTIDECLMPPDSPVYMPCYGRDKEDAELTTISDITQQSMALLKP